jgi:hypothetical protein
MIHNPLTILHLPYPMSLFHTFLLGIIDRVTSLLEWIDNQEY